MNVVLNGAPREIPADSTVQSLVESLGVGERRVAVMVNDRIAKKDERATIRLSEGDRVEVVHMVGGG